MPIRQRKLIGAFALLVLVIIWSLGVMAVSQSPAIASFFASGRAAQIAFYAIAGMGWIIPAMPLIYWMQKPNPSA